MKIIIDTSSFIRATLERDFGAKEVIKKALSDFEIVMTDEMAQELLRAIYIVAGRKGRNPLPAYLLASIFLLQAKRIETKTKFPWCYDPDDAMFIECAIDSGAKFVVSNDRSLTTLKEYVADKKALELIKDIEFLTPEEFLKLYT